MIQAWEPPQDGEKQLKAPKETEGIKRKLQSYGALQRRIDNDVQRLRTLEASMGSISSPDLSGMPKGGGDGTSKIERIIVQKDELERKIARQRVQERRLLDELEGLIDLLKDPDEHTVIEMRYIDCLRYWPICEALYSSMPDYEDNAEKYLKKTFKVHGSALQALARVYREDD